MVHVNSFFLDISGSQNHISDGAHVQNEVQVLLVIRCPNFSVVGLAGVPRVLVAVGVLCQQRLPTLSCSSKNSLITRTLEIFHMYNGSRLTTARSNQKTVVSREVTVGRWFPQISLSELDLRMRWHYTTLFLKELLKIKFPGNDI